MSTKRHIHQVLAGFSDGDAISCEAKILRDHLHAMGFESEIYADWNHVAPLMQSSCRPLTEYKATASDIVLHHYAISSPATDAYLRSPARKIMIYHNITPSEFFLGFDDGVAAQLDQGREALRVVAGDSDIVLADSQYNADELLDLGVSKAQVLPLLFSPDQFDRTPDPAVLARYKVDMQNILFVGRVAPNKRIEELILAYAWYFVSINPYSRLIIVGSPSSCPRYYTMLRLLVGDLKLRHVCFEGFASDEGLTACYEKADVFVTASAHEGYCLPLVEAMHKGVPVIARNTGGMPEALGGAGILFDEAAPEELAVLINKTIEDTTLRNEVLASQKKRMDEVKHRDIESELQEIVSTINH